MSELKELIEHVSQNFLVKILSSFTSATNMQALLVDRNGDFQIPLKSNCKFCQTILNDPVGYNKCKGSYARAGEQAAQFGEPYIFRCHAGLVAFAAPIITEGKLIGSVICGQVLMWQPEDFFWEEIEEATAGLNINPKELIIAAEELEIVSTEKVQAAADLLFLVANHIMENGILSLQHRRETALRQKQLSEEIQRRKKLEEKLAEVENCKEQLSFQTEKELMSKVRLGDKKDAELLLNEIVSELIKKHVSHPKAFKIRILELITMISKASVEGGANPDKLMNHTYQYLEDISKIEQVEELCNLVFKVLGEAMEHVFGNVDNKYVDVIDKATLFIRTNYENNLNLNDIAQAVYISPYYLSHIFKDQLNCTVMEYLTKVRMEEAKKLLRNPKLSVVNISQKIGFKDPGHFCRVFKKKEGLTPSAFKKKLM